MCKKWIRTSELAAFEAITFTGTFGPLLWEKFYCVRGCCLYSLLKKFRALNFRGLGQQRNFFNNENFPIYGSHHVYVYSDSIYIYSHHVYVYSDSIYIYSHHVYVYSDSIYIYIVTMCMYTVIVYIYI